VEEPRKVLPSVGYAHIPGTDQCRGTSKSRYNPVEAQAIAKWLKQRRPEIIKGFQSDKKRFGELVGIITPFKAQERAIRAALNSELGAEHGITVGTVHALQGAERRVIIFSPTYGLNTEPGATFFDRDRSMLNVAISRAQDAFFIIGNMHLFRPIGNHPGAVIGRMLFSDGSNELTDVDTQLLCPGVDMTPGSLIRSLDGHRATLREAFTSARSRIIVVSPFITAAALRADSILNQVQDAVRRGVRVSVVSDPALNEKRNDYGNCLRDLESAGAKIRLTTSQGVHSKMLLVDRAWLAVGSFNWLSAVRDIDSPYARYESSMRYDGDDAFQMIAHSLRDLSEIFHSP
jgi:AAA domain/PLD-like domain